MYYTWKSVPSNATILLIFWNFLAQENIQQIYSSKKSFKSLKFFCSFMLRKIVLLFNIVPKHIWTGPYVKHDWATDFAFGITFSIFLILPSFIPYLFMNQNVHTLFFNLFNVLILLLCDLSRAISICVIKSCSGV